MQSVIFDVEFQIVIGNYIDLASSVVAAAAAAECDDAAFVLTVVVDAESIPSVNMLQGGLLNDEGYLREFFLFVKRLLKCASTDPGFVNAKEVHLTDDLRLVLSNV